LDAGVPAEAPVPVGPAIEKPGDRIDRYKLLQQLGEGGCGVVYMAEQEEPVRRRVALKVIKLGMDTREVIARFEAERQALALMDHPNIAKVLDAGATAAGRPYFVMELVRGVRITEYCDQHNLPTRERLGLFIKVCQAIQHAHQKGIIHRDIKPSNILVTVNDGVAVPKVIDFGIAKATEGRLTDKTLFTAFQQFMGTPAYMSPEQAEMTSLDIDTRSDIYSLGVLLYELLTGKTPFDARELLAAGLDALRRTIREQEPPRPSTRLSTLLAADQTEIARCRHTDPPRLMNLLRGELDWIVMKALEKDRTRRYETANGFALDIRRYLADEPVTAAAPSAVYRFGKFARRNKAALSVAAAIAFILVIATAASTWQAIRATKAEELVKKRVLEVAAERDAKDKARRESEAITTFLTQIFESPDPRRAGRNITVAETLGRVVNKLNADLAIPPERRAQLQTTFGRTYRALGFPREAIPLHEKVLEYVMATHGPGHQHTLSAMTDLANSYDDAGRRTEALKLREEVLPLSRKVHGPEHPSTLNVMENLAISYRDAGRRDAARKLQEELLPLRRKVLGPEHSETIHTMQNLAMSYRDAGRRDEALQLQEQVLSVSRKVYGPEHPATLNAINNLAISHLEALRFDQSITLLEEALPLTRQVNGPNHPDTVEVLMNLANSYDSAGRRDEALKMREEVLTISRKTNGHEHTATLGAMTNLAISYGVAGRFDEAIRLQEEALAIKRRVLPANHPFLGTALLSMANLYGKAGREQEAEAVRKDLADFKTRIQKRNNNKTTAPLAKP
jgi:tetratricopeptide (TPR) repeat protein